jgi:hypothetical protein
METNAYHFITQWRIKAPLAEIMTVIGDAQALPRWWPSVYLDVKQLTAGDASGMGKQIALYTKGWLPYTLRWQFEVTEVQPLGFTLVATGDFIGRGIWTFASEGDTVLVTYDWKISAEKPLLKRLSFVLKPIFSMNHHWAMRKGEASLLLELQRRSAQTEAARAAIPAPPPATPSNPLRWFAFILTHRGAF